MPLLRGYYVNNLWRLVLFSAVYSLIGYEDLRNQVHVSFIKAMFWISFVKAKLGETHVHHKEIILK